MMLISQRDPRGFFRVRITVIEAGDEKDNQLPADDRIAILSGGLLNFLGADACDVIGTQIEAADSGEARATWTAIWDRLCTPTARRG